MYDEFKRKLAISRSHGLSSYHKTHTAILHVCVLQVLDMKITLQVLLKVEL